MGLGGLCCSHGIVFNVSSSFISKEWVIGGFSGVCPSLAPVWVVAVLQVEYFIDRQPFQLLQFFNGLHTCFNFRVCGV